MKDEAIIDKDVPRVEAGTMGPEITTKTFEEEQLQDSTNLERIKSFSYDLLFGSSMAVFAAILAFNDMGAGKYGAEELKKVNERSATLAWYQSKSIKESLVEGQRDLLKTLMVSNATKADKTTVIEKYIHELDKKLLKYKKEKSEIFLGSKAVGKDNWVQDIDGKYGQITGSKELELTLEKLGAAGDRFDTATLLLQFSLVIGAVGIIIKAEKVKNIFLLSLILIGIIGSICCVRAWLFALNI